MTKQTIACTDRVAMLKPLGLPYFANHTVGPEAFPRVWLAEDGEDSEFHRGLARGPRDSTDFILVDPIQRIVGLGMRGDQWPLPKCVWTFGGAVAGAERADEGAARICTSDTSDEFAVEPSDLVPVCLHSCTWTMPPATVVNRHGTPAQLTGKHDMILLHALGADADRFGDITLRKGEYAEPRKVLLFRSAEEIEAYILDHCDDNPDTRNAIQVHYNTWDAIFGRL